MVVCRKCGDWFERLGGRETDSDADRIRRRLGGPVSLALGTAALFFYFIVLPDGVSSLQIGYWIIIAGSYIGPLFLLSRVSTAATMGGMILCCTAGALAFDLAAAARLRPRAWGYVVIALDACLVFSLHSAWQSSLIAITLLYLAVERVEAAVHFGFYSAGTTMDVVEGCDCSSPPCAVLWSAAFVDGGMFAVILLTDFVLTHGFAAGLRRQVALVDASIEAAGQVSAALACFDLDAAGGVLEKAGGQLPEGLACSLRQLLRNLASYRPYLPQSCFEAQDSDGGEDGQEDSGSAPRAATDEGLPTKSFSSRQDRLVSIAPSQLSSSVQSESPADSTARRGSSDHAAGPSARGVRQPQTRRVTLLARNSCGLLESAALCDAQAVGEWLAAEVDRFQSTVAAQGGVPDLLSGDHLGASFGALRVQGTQRESAVRAAVALAVPVAGAGELGARRITTAVCCGKALCGDFGSAAAQRFMIIGAVGAFLPALERAAAAWSVRALVDAAVAADAEHIWNCRLRKRVTFPKLSGAPIGLWEIVRAKPSVLASEWMYEMADAGPNPWQCYNEAVEAWCNKGSAEALLDAVAVSLAVLPRGAVADALAALRDHALSGADPPQGPLTAAAYAGEPAPIGLLSSHPPGDAQSRSQSAVLEW
eukprot:TRINITY_DN4999_c1_g4_i1.p1 TRINITY_DN4999_c1_g4~~TRINITY_DN4999_c1_g4_i1.p1  ORF type:complete len:676 (+),score=131.80 TRINITY_DN4999_c1_g4_i1:79-2028(+)